MPYQQHFCEPILSEDLISCAEGFIETINSDKQGIQTNPEKFAKACGIQRPEAEFLQLLSEIPSFDACCNAVT